MPKLEISSDRNTVLCLLLLLHKNGTYVKMFWHCPKKNSQLFHVRWTLLQFAWGLKAKRHTVEKASSSKIYTWTRLQRALKAWSRSTFSWTTKWFFVLENKWTNRWILSLSIYYFSMTSKAKCSGNNLKIPKAKIQREVLGYMDLSLVCLASPCTVQLNLLLMVHTYYCDGS